MRHVLAIRPRSSSEKHAAEERRGLVYERHGFNFIGGKRVQRTLTISLLSLLATIACVVLFSRRKVVGVAGLFTPTSYEVVPGFFAQSLNTTDDITFDFVPLLIPRLSIS